MKSKTGEFPVFPSKLRTVVIRKRLHATKRFDCEICGAPFERVLDVHLDHDHATGHPRGILCKTCNAGIGFLRDNPLIIEAAWNYLQRFSGKDPSHTLRVREFVSAGQIFRLCGLHKWEIFKLMDEGKFPAPTYVPNPTLKWRKSDVVKWIEDRGLTLTEQDFFSPESEVSFHRQMRVNRLRREFKLA